MENYTPTNEWKASYPNAQREYFDSENRIMLIRTLRPDLSVDYLRTQAVAEAEHISMTTVNFVLASSVLNRWVQIVGVGAKLPFELT